MLKIEEIIALIANFRIVMLGVNGKAVKKVLYFSSHNLNQFQIS